MRALVVIIVCICGCAWQTEPEPYREKLDTDVIADLLIDEYEARFGDLPARCPDHLHNVVFVGRGEPLYRDGDFALGVDEEAVGQHLYDHHGNSFIWVDENLSEIDSKQVNRPANLFNRKAIRNYLESLIWLTREPIFTSICEHYFGQPSEIFVD